MRVGLWRWLTFAVVFVPVLALGAGAQPPLAGEKPASDRNGGTDTAAERAKLQADLLNLLRRINTTPAPPMPYPPAPAPSKGKADTGIGTGKEIDRVREGMNYFRDGDIEAARRTFQLIDPASLGSREDRAFVRYMLACCLRKQNKIADAETVYREVASDKDDEFLANCAIWQLSLIRSDQELQAQLEQLRSRAKSK